MKLALLVLAPVLGYAQLSLFSVSGTTTTPVGAVYNLGTAASGTSLSAQFRVLNSGNNPVVVTPVLNNGQPGAFSLSSVSGANPCTGPNALVCVQFTVTFQAPPQTLTNNYSAPLEVTSPSTGSVTVLLLATAVPAPALTGFPPGCSPGGASSIAFAPVDIGTGGLCNFSLQNPNSVPIVISNIAVSGDAAFQLGQGVQTPLTISPNNAITFAVQFTPRCGTAIYSGTLMVNSSAYPLSGNGITPALPTPRFNFDAASFSSMEQHTLTMTLPSAAVCGASGNVNLAFAPSVSVTDDATIVFVSTTSRSLAFTVKAGSTQVMINNQSSAVFATGSTAGTISFSVSGAQPALAGVAPVVAFPISPTPIVIDSATASNQRLGELDVEVIGYDNTYSEGKMSFTFFDASGNAIGAPIAADFTSSFQGFYAGQQIGSTFLMRVSFPVSGNQALVAKVQATLTNAAGQTQTGSLTFQ